MRLTPRKHEIQALVGLLTDPGFESPEDMAKAVLKEAASILQMRDLWVLTHRWADGSKGLNYGPFGSVAEAEAFAKKMSFGGTGRAIPLTSSGIALANHDGKAGWPGYCYDPQCGHPPYTHSAASAARGKCHVTTCDCDKFVKDAPKSKKK
ncbi:hypothetical protein [Streptomyces sp. STCH 565 A]|uniref:hypothetical protein n=1 Tax=Streptomyces sp. STCH 565 A TaxID=2950532 RepID=UPI002074B116|nr:hypothetical protein [Streptomyces sp. STCH 565 A]MCM8548854.1 hypothetical protein [Streptomyces sp. STCH 565 A]